MGDLDEQVHSAAGGRRQRRSRILNCQTLIAGSWGIGVAAVALSVYAFVRRVPDGLVSDRLGPATQTLGGSLGVVAVTAVVLVVGGVAILAGREVAGKAAWALTVVAAVTSFAFLSSLLRRGTEAVSGPGARPVVALVQMSWLLLAVAAALLVAAAALASEKSRRPVKWSVMAGVGAVGVVLALVAGVGVVALTQRGAPQGSRAAAITLPEVPTAVGSDTAYTLTTEYLSWFVPAGPGFALVKGGALTTYSGVDGGKRWRFLLKSFPTGCELWSIRSTGTGPDAVVVAECNHNAGYGEPRTDPFLVGLDAMTGRLLWTLDQGWSLRSRILLPSNTIPVVNSERDELGSLDPRTGALRWTWSFEESDKQCGDTGYVGALEGGVMYAKPCGPVLRVHVFDAVTGSDRVFDGPVPPEVSDGPWVVEPQAIDGSTAVVSISRTAGGNGTAVLSIDTAGGQVSVLPPKYLSDGDSGKIGQYPGPVLQLDYGSKPEDWVDLYRLSDRSTIHAVGLDIFTVSPYAPRSSMAWAEVGSQMVTAAASDDEYNKLLVSVSRDGVVTRRPSPCGGSDAGGVMPVPGAVLVVCHRSVGDKTLGYDIVGLR